MKVVFHIIIVIFLTILTQIGGIVYLISIFLIKKNKENYKVKRGFIFLGIYIFSTFIIVPFIASIFGRERIKESNLLEAHTFFTKLANRNYVKPPLNKLLTEVSTVLDKKYSGIKLIYLDANFPFLNKFPLLPHLSHNDGEKIDLALLYKDKSGKLTNKKQSVSGYGVFVEPTKTEYNQTVICKNKGYWQYDYPKYLTLGSMHKEISFSAEATKFLIGEILKKSTIGKIFIEPHLKKRMKLNHPKIRFHGCGAVRHDDHIHIQLR